MKTQAWDQCDAVKNNEGRTFFIGLIGFNICFFRFDIIKFNKSDWFTNFSPISLDNFDQFQLRGLGVKPIVESIGNTDVMQVIPWRLDNENHHQYIIRLYQHISNMNPY